jgi:hypothetical protein
LTSFTSTAAFSTLRVEGLLGYCRYRTMITRIIQHYEVEHSEIHYKDLVTKYYMELDVEFLTCFAVAGVCTLFFVTSSLTVGAMSVLDSLPSKPQLAFHHLRYWMLSEATPSSHSPQPSLAYTATPAGQCSQPLEVPPDAPVKLRVPRYPPPYLHYHFDYGILISRCLTPMIIAAIHHPEKCSLGLIAEGECYYLSSSLLHHLLSRLQMQIPPCATPQ